MANIDRNSDHVPIVVKCVFNFLNYQPQQAIKWDSSKLVDMLLKGDHRDEFFQSLENHRQANEWIFQRAAEHSVEAVTSILNNTLRQAAVPLFEKKKIEDPDIIEQRRIRKQKS